MTKLSAIKKLLINVKTDEKLKPNDFVKMSSMLNEKEFEELKKDNNEIVTVTEKIDGANFSIKLLIHNGEIYDIMVCKRTGPIEEEKELFVGCIEILKNYVESIKKLAKMMENEYKEKCIVTIFGELYGEKIMKRINYCSNEPVNLVFYSLTINNKYIDFEKSSKYISEAGLPLVPIICSGTFEKVKKLILNNG